MKKIITVALAIILAFQVNGQERRAEIYANIEKSAGLLYPYPGPQSIQTPAPKGYKPFYISHFGRHGSRWHTQSGTYTRPVKALSQADSAGVLTPLGKDVLARMTVLAENAAKRQGELTPLGFRQHREIATRMFRSFPEVFKNGRSITATSTSSPRVELSMFSFCSTLQGLNPRLEISMDAGGRHNRYLKGSSAEAEAFKKSGSWNKVKHEAEERWTNPERLISTLFADDAYVKENVNSTQLYEDLFNSASIALDMETDVRLHDIFTKEELYDMWQKNSLNYYLIKGPNPAAGDSILSSSAAEIAHIITCADEALKDGNIAATLRFSHDSYLAPLTTCLRLDGCRTGEADPAKVADVWANYKVSPMAGNLQFIFFRNRKDDVIVKIMLNENEVGIPVGTDIYPFYHWNDVRKFYTDLYGL